MQEKTIKSAITLKSLQEKEMEKQNKFYRS